ncbi:heavy-metal-associated domain-containing protein [Segnochrobactraceae bacterium EtOH-i3]
MIELTVSGMTCGGCVKSVEKVVKRTDPDATAKVDLASGHVSIESGKPAAVFAEAITAAGFPVTA